MTLPTESMWSLRLMEKLDYTRILEKMGGRFKDLSEEEKERIAVEAKKWARIK